MIEGVNLLINSIMEFKRGQDPSDGLNIGLNPAKKWLASKNISYNNIERAIVNGDTVFYIDVVGDVFLPDFHISDVYSIPDYIKFRDVSGRFIFENSHRANANRTFEGIIDQNDVAYKLGIGLIKLTKDWLIAKDISYNAITRTNVNGNIVFYIDVVGDVFLDDFHINDVYNIPDHIRFRNVSGSFILGNSK